MSQHADNPTPPSREPADAAACDVTAVAAAMLRLTLPHLASGLCLRAALTSDGISLHAAYESNDAAARSRGCEQQIAADLMVIDFIATRWGHCGNPKTRSLWAIIRDEPHGQP
jgi:hypothetical protein